MANPEKVRELLEQRKSQPKAIDRHPLDYRILATGSSGNAARIENIMVDCGIPYSQMKSELYKVDALLLTHSHSDHLKRRTFERIRKEFPHIKVFAGADVAQLVPVDKVIGVKPFEIPRGHIKVTPVRGCHDVEVLYFYMTIKGNHVLYATDTAEVINPTGDKIDYCFLESNYDEHLLEKLASKYKRSGYDPVFNAHRHLSQQACRRFWYANRRSNDSPLIELHMSKRFYSRF